MKKVLLMAVFLFPRVLAAQSLEIDDYLGESWYGLYLNGEKAGYSLNALRREEGALVAVEDSRFRITMAGVKQDMHIYSRRAYAADGALISIDSEITDPAGVSEFHAKVQGELLTLESMISGTTSTVSLPKPKETLADAIKYARWVKEAPKVGDSLSFSVFEPMYQREISGTSYILAKEQKVFEGVETRVYKIKTVLDLMGVETISHVAEDGTTLEDVVAGIITMRLEPEEIAKDVDYNNDVIVSNAALVDEPIKDPRKRESLRLVLKAPLTADHLFNDERQSVTVQGESFLFESHQIDVKKLTPVKLPVEDPEVVHWLLPTPFIQSDNPKLVEKAHEIIGEEKDSLKISNKLCDWVYKNTRSTFSARLTNALEVLDSMEGDCTEHSILFIGLARAAGLPAREVAGLVYVEGVQPGFYFHQWAKVWVGTWIDVDPTFNQPVADVTHIKLAEGDLFQQARLIPVIGRMEIKVAPAKDQPKS
ncbi:MAG: transglutaminase domain-containing protein [Candidatus Hydrogenedentes bacterium]|nr:transglutaminase domain-containing protein [Candidatus Hydrogenedentota bacterium]